MSRFRYKFTPFSLETRKSLDGSWRFTPSDECRYLKLNFNWNILFPDLCALGAEKNPLQFAESLYSFWLAFVFPRASHSCNRNSSSAIRHLESVDLIENSNINLSWEVQYNEKFMKSFGELNKSCEWPASSSNIPKYLIKQLVAWFMNPPLRPVRGKHSILSRIFAGARGKLCAIPKTISPCNIFQRAAKLGQVSKWGNLCFNSY